MTRKIGFWQRRKFEGWLALCVEDEKYVGLGPKRGWCRKDTSCMYRFAASPIRLRKFWTERHPLQKLGALKFTAVAYELRELYTFWNT